MSARIRRRVVVHGLVQGVWFRESCRREATVLGIDGWVRNRGDGTVEAVFEGSEHVVARVLSWCRSGPPHAEVTDVDLIDEPPEGLDGFSVR